VCPLVLCDPVPAGDAIPAGCTTPATKDSSTNAKATITFTITVPCDDPAVDALVGAAGSTAQDAVGTNYPGTVSVTKNKCVDNTASGKRQSGAVVSNDVTIDGPAADTAMGAALGQLSNTQLAAPGGATGTYQSSSPAPTSSGLSGGAIAGIVIGCIAAVAIALLLVVVMMQHSRDAERY